LFLSAADASTQPRNATRRPLLPQAETGFLPKTRFLVNPKKFDRYAPLERSDILDGFVMA
jgi:hypothetical protein